MAIKIKNEGVDPSKAAKKIERDLRKLNGEVQEVLKDLIDDAEKDVKSGWPEVSGRSKKGFRTKTRGKTSAELRNDVDYSGYVQDGRADREIEAFIKKESSRVEEELNDIFQDLMSF